MNELPSWPLTYGRTYLICLERGTGGWVKAIYIGPSTIRSGWIFEREVAGRNVELHRVFEPCFIRSA